MKKALMTLVILALFSATAYASGPYTVFLLTENEDPLAASCDIYPGAFEPVDFRLWVQSDPATGLQGFELGIDLGPAQYAGATKNPGVPSIIGDLLTTAFAGAFTTCQTQEWVWIAKYSFPYTGTPHMVFTVPAWDSGNYIVTSCEVGYPQYPLIEGNQFGVAMPCVVDAETESWGAVKSMYR
ncbi:MAG: hypothetical protein GF417_10080 [Candidatus Latescibacteria bacterium]|nr:hypothetical protein [bacterium]MBD3424774.1 hypothetical protein [Candidatus Latescibacterota bacterium]